MARIPQPLELPPGFNRRSSRLAVEGRWYTGDKVRSVGGIIETLGGWAKMTGSPQVLGICRGLFSWRSLADVKSIVIGTHRRLYRLATGTLVNITPFREQGTLGADPFSTTTGSATVVVTDTSHALAVNVFVTYAGASTVGGLDMNDTFAVTTVVDADTYEIVHTSSASSTATGGGASVGYKYEINPGLVDTIDADGYGVGTYGSGTYGTPRVGGAFQLRARTWTLDDWGEDLVACHRNGSIYYYDISTEGDADGRAVLLANAPTDNVGMFVAPNRHIFALGANGQRMEAAWSDIDDTTIWTAGAANQAGSLQLTGGSEIIGGRPLGKELAVIWSDTDLFRVLYLGRSPWYAIRSEGSGVGLCGPLAHIEFGGIAYWIGCQNFYRYGGAGIQVVSSQEDVKTFVFDDEINKIDETQSDKIIAFRNPQFREIWWIYQSVSGSEIDRYVFYSLRDGVFYFGTWQMVAMEDGLIIGHPIGVDADGYLYDHEQGEDADGSAMSKSVESSYFDLEDGARAMDVVEFWPDYETIIGKVSLTLIVADQAQGETEEDGPHEMTSRSDLVDTRANGRVMAFKLESNEVGGKFRLGRQKVVLDPAQERRA